MRNLKQHQTYWLKTEFLSFDTGNKIRMPCFITSINTVLEALANVIRPIKKGIPMKKNN
jgi:hypothetical protein